MVLSLIVVLKSAGVANWFCKWKYYFFMVKSFIGSFHVYKINSKEKTNNIANCFIQLGLKSIWLNICTIMYAMKKSPMQKTYYLSK